MHRYRISYYNALRGYNAYADNRNAWNAACSKIKSTTLIDLDHELERAIDNLVSMTFNVQKMFRN